MMRGRAGRKAAGLSDAQSGGVRNRAADVTTRAAPPPNYPTPASPALASLHLAASDRSLPPSPFVAGCPEAARGGAGSVEQRPDGRRS